MGWRWVKRRQKNHIVHCVELVQPERIIRKPLTESLNKVVGHRLICLPKEFTAGDKGLGGIPEPLDVWLTVC